MVRISRGRHHSTAAPYIPMRTRGSRISPSGSTTANSGAPAPGRLNVASQTKADLILNAPWRIKDGLSSKRFAFSLFWVTRTFMLPNVFPPIDPHVRIGHVHLKVADLQRSLDFYCGVLGFQLMQRYGEEAAFISAGSYHHHIGLNTWESAGAKPPPPNATGLYHVAILYPGRVQLADALSRLKRANIPLDGASDHGVSEALYLRDPDSNGIELCWDRPRELWPSSPTGAVQMFTRPLDLRDLLAELGQN